MIRSKYGNKKVPVVVGKQIIKFDSIKEAKRYEDLYLLEKAKKISNLEIQPEFILSEAIRHNGKTFKSVKYIADFRYIQDGKVIVEDVKGFKTDVYSVKVKWFLSLYGNEINFREM